MRALPHPRTGEGTAVLAVLALAAVELVVLSVIPEGHRPVVGAVLLVTAAVMFVMLAVLVHARRTHHGRERRVRETVEPLFTPETLAGFPFESVRPLLPDPDAPSLNRLYTAWVLATHGHDAPWIAHHLDLPSAVVQPLVDAARQQQGRDQQAHQQQPVTHRVGRP